MPAWLLFALAVLIWGTTWHAILYQLQHATPEFGVALRFVLAGLAILAVRALRGLPWRLPPGWHGRIAFQGIFMYSVSYLCVYHAERHVPSGLVAVGYSASPLVMGVASHLLWGTPLTRRFLLGGTAGVAGVALIFWPEIAAVLGGSGGSPAGAGHGPEGGHALLGAAFTVGAVLLSAVGSLAASRTGRDPSLLWPSMGWGMLYGGLCSAVAVVVGGQPVALPSAPSFWLSLLYLSACGSVVAFACYLVLQQRWGPGQASTVGVATPVLALAVSTALEGYRPGLAALCGTLLAIAGNALVLWPTAGAGASGYGRGTDVQGRKKPPEDLPAG